MKRMIRYCIFLLLLYPVAGRTTVLPIEKVKKDPEASSSGATIVVTVHLKNSAGKPKLLKDLRVFLCREQVSGEISRIRTTGRLLAQQTGNYKALVGDLPFMEGRADAAGIQNLVADAAGKCTFENIERGSYVLYAGYHDEAGAGYWLLPVKVSDTKKLVLMLTEKNMAESVENR